MRSDTADRDHRDPEGSAVADGDAADDEGLDAYVAHLYRAEMDRTVNWRTRLDSTTNWAVTVIAAILAYAFSRGDLSHAIILVAMLIGVVFLVVETRRFRRYDVWRSRLRTLQENAIAGALEPSRGPEHADWRRRLSEDLRNPALKLSLRKALAHRLRRVYLPLLVSLLLVWLLRLSGNEASMVEAAAVGAAPGWLVVACVAVVYVALAGCAVVPNATAATETSQESEGRAITDE
jgi:uncharacterized membrane protein